MNCKITIEVDEVVKCFFLTESIAKSVKAGALLHIAYQESDTVSMFTTTDLAKELGVTEQRLRKKLILDNVMYKLRSANGMRNLRAGYENLGTQSMYYTPEMKVLGAAPDYTLKWNTDGREFILSNYSEWAA